MKLKIKYLAVAMAMSLAISPCIYAKTVKVGVLGPNTGPYASIGKDVLNGVNLFFGQNDFKVSGKTIKVIPEDSQGKPNVGLTKVKKLVEKNHVDFIAGVVSSSVAYAIRDYLVKKDVPLILTVASADGLTQDKAAPNVFRTGTAGSQNSHPLGQWLIDNGYKHIILMAPNYSMGYEQTGGVARVVTQNGGKVVQELYPPLGAADYAPYLSKLKVGDADALVAVFAGSDALKFVKQATLYGIKNKIQIVGPSALITDSSILPQEGDDAVGIISSSFYTDAIDTPRNKTFVAAFHKKFDGYPDIYVESSYVAAKAIYRAVTKLDGDLSDTSDVNDALHSVSFKAPRGHFAFGKYNSPINNVYIMKVQKEGGRYVNEPFYEYDDVSQFWKWSPTEYMSLPSYHDTPGKWADK